MSDKSNALSGICLALFARCLARADNADRFLPILKPPNRIHNEENSPGDRKTQPYGPQLGTRMLEIIPIQSLGIAEDGRRFLERNTVFRYVA